ncbi:hypothetical protein SDC9_115146 [bioreactor metagenome]|uniref:Type I restriction enzyme HindI endonuclease subunit-like C-terminal domain-containing protein n=1 Tax=bioreactor metagenome TaxID=1076179 RepID=A0A645BSA7_9ZZZZ
MKEKNIAVEMLKKLLNDRIRVYQKVNLVKSVKFSELMQNAMNLYINGLITNEQVIEELLKLAQEMKRAQEEANDLGLTDEEMAFYDALTKPQAILDFYSNEQLVAITKELTEILLKNKTVDWQKRDSARSGMRMLIKRLLKKYKYPPENMNDALQIVMNQCELWADENAAE